MCVLRVPKGAISFPLEAEHQVLESSLKTADPNISRSELDMRMRSVCASSRKIRKDYQHNLQIFGRLCSATYVQRALDMGKEWEEHECNSPFVQFPKGRICEKNSVLACILK